MSGFKKYIFNYETLSYELKERTATARFMRAFLLFLASLCAFFLYLWIYTSVLGLELPKTTILKKSNANWNSRMELMNRQLDHYEEILSSLEMRDDGIYRSIFGMNEIPDEIRNAGFGGVNRYSWLDNADCGYLLKTTYLKMDRLTKKSYVQSRSFDDVMALSRRAGEMASCIPAVPPIVPDRSNYRLSSSFGYRSDPISGKTAFHEGMDFSIKTGNPVYATGDGVVETVFYGIFGYGNYVLIDHGFGYKTRYAHLSSSAVTEGMKVKRGELIAYSGNSGKSTGDHLHYEVIYRGRQINPYNYLDMDMPLDEYNAMITKAAEMSGREFEHPFLKGKK